MKVQTVTGLKEKFKNAFAVFGAVYAGMVSEIDILEEENWLGIG